MLPSQGFHDVGDLQTNTAILGIAHTTGYPTYVILGKILTTFLPFGEIAWKVNFLSVLYSIAALFMMYLLLVKMTKDYFWPVFGVIYLAFSLPFWNWSGLADTHTLSRLFLFLLILLFFKLSIKWTKIFLFIFTVTLGLGLGNHLLLIYSLPGFLIWYFLLLITRRISVKIIDIGIVILGLFVGLAVYLLLPLRHNVVPALSYTYDLRTWEGFYRHVSGSDFHNLMFQGGLLNVLKSTFNGAWKLYEYLYLPGLLLGIIGAIYGLIYYRIPAISLLIMFFSFLLFSTNYPTSDTTRYYLSYVSIFSLFIGIGCYCLSKLLKDWMKRLKLMRLTNLLLLFLILMATPLYQIKNNFKTVDKSKNIDASIYSKRIFESVDYQAVILSWWNNSTPLWYRKYVLHKRPDIIILNKNQDNWKIFVDQYINIQPVYLTDRNEEVENYYTLEPYGAIFKVIPNE